MAEDFVGTDGTESNAAFDSFTFEWIVGNYSSANLSERHCREFVSKLGGGFEFKIHVYRCDSINQFGQRKNQFKVRAAMKKVAKNCIIKTLLLYEICNSSKQLYLKNFIEKQFSRMNGTYDSDGFEIPPPYHVYSPQRMQLVNQIAFIEQDLYRYVQRNRRENEIIFNDNKFILKGSVIFQCGQEKIISEPLCQNFNQLQSDLRSLLQNNFCADMKFLIGDDVMHAHKNILCSRSVVFRKMFEQNMKETECNTVKIADIKKPVFAAFLNFLYTGTIPDKTFEIIMPLYSVADKYAVQTLLTTCSNLLVSYITDKTVPLILKLADMHNDGTLKATAVDFICKNFAEVEITDSWDTLLNSDPRLASYALKQVSISAAKNVSK